MSWYYPQAAMTLTVLWEDFNLKSDPTTQKTYQLSVLAKRLTVKNNDYSTADTFEAEIDYKSFPFDPRCIRSCGVTIHMENMEKLTRAGRQAQIVPSTANTIFQGFADEEGIDFDDESRTVKLEGRDFTALLIDQKYLENKPVDVSQPLDVIIKTLLAQIPAFAKITFDDRTGVSPLPVMKAYAPDFNSKLAGQKNTARDDTYWDIITDLVARAGLICYIELDKLVLSSPRVMYNPSQAKKFVYGKNLKTLKFKRKLGRHKGFNVQVRALNIQTKEVLTASIPAQATVLWSKLTGVANSVVKVPVVKPDGTQGEPQIAPAMSFRVKDVANLDKLIEIGEKIYEELSRQQIDGEFTTKEMEADQIDGACFDLLGIRNGTPVQIELDAADLHGISRITSDAEREKFLVARGYEKSVAQVLARTFNKFPNVFYTKAVTFRMDASDGFALTLEFVNFIDLKL